MKNKVSINLGTGDKNFGFSDSDCNCRDSVNYVGEIRRFQCELKRFRNSTIELNKPTSKKIRVL